jgi:mannose-6-phosphate isomerase-like protein (cupin superfamily)
MTNFAKELEKVTEYWTPRVVGEVNDHYVKVAKLKGEFVWHAHENEDELFFIVYGTLRIQLEGRDEVVLEQGDFFTVPKGVRHNPVAEEEVGVVLIETKSTLHTGDVVTDRTVPVERQLGVAES